jgi:hypothetical protein
VRLDHRAGQDPGLPGVRGRGGKRLNLADYYAFLITGTEVLGLLEEASGPRKAKKFGSVEERCGNCKVYGGRYRPCLNVQIRRDIKAREGRPCPRVLLDSENDDAYELLRWGNEQGGMAGFAHVIFDAIREEQHLSLEQSRTLLNRVSSAMNSKVVTDAIERARKVRADRESNA